MGGGLEGEGRYRKSESAAPTKLLPRRVLDLETLTGASMALIPSPSPVTGRREDFAVRFIAWLGDSFVAPVPCGRLSFPKTGSGVVLHNPRVIETRNHRHTVLTRTHRLLLKLEPLPPIHSNGQ